MPRSVSWWSGATIEEAPRHRVRFRICADAFHSEADRRSLVTAVQKGERLQSGSTGRRTRIPDFAGRRTRTRIMLRAKMILLTIKMTRPLRRVDPSRRARRRREKILFWEWNFIVEKGKRYGIIYVRKEFLSFYIYVVLNLIYKYLYWIDEIDSHLRILEVFESRIIVIIGSVFWKWNFIVGWKRLYHVWNYIKEGISFFLYFYYWI